MPRADSGRSVRWRRRIGEVLCVGRAPLGEVDVLGERQAR